MTDPAPSGFFEGVFDRTLTNLRERLARDRRVGARRAGRRAAARRLRVDDTDRLRQQMLSCLDGRGGEVTARARAADLGRTYLFARRGWARAVPSAARAANSMSTATKSIAAAAR